MISRKIARSFWVIFWYVILIPLPSEAKDLFISTIGDDSVAYANNDIDHPWRTPYLSAAKMQEKDTLYFRAGTYNIKTPLHTSACGATETIVAAANDVTFKAYPGETVTVQGGDPDNGRSNYGESPAGFVFCSSSYSNITWDGFIVKGVIGLIGSGSGNVIQNCNLSEGGDNWIDNQQGEVVLIQHNQSNWKIKNSRLHDNGPGEEGGGNNAGLIMGYVGNNGLIENCDIYNSSGPGINLKDSITDTVLRYNYIHDNARSGIWTANQGSPHGIDIYQNIFQNNNTINDAEAGAITFTINTSDVDIYNNTFYGNHVADFRKWTGDNSMTGTFFNNISHSPASNHLDWYYSGATFTFTYLDYNNYYNDLNWRYKSSSYSTLSDWQTFANTLLTGADSHSTITDPGFATDNGDYSGTDFTTAAAFKRSSYPTNGRGESYPSVMGAYITGNETIGYMEPTTYHTLLDLDWDGDTTCNTSNLYDGVFTDSMSPGTLCTNFGIGTGGPGGRNYLKHNITDSGSNSLKDPRSLGNPPTTYVRFWFKMNYWMNVDQHPLWINSYNTAGGSGCGMCLLRGTGGNSFSFIATAYGETSDPGSPYVYTGTLNAGQWYRLEYKMQNAGTGNGSIEVRLDGNDITGMLRSNDTGRIDIESRQGNIYICPLNYLYVSNYSNGPDGEWLDIAGMKITDGPDWIGEDSDGNKSPKTPIGLAVS